MCECPQGVSQFLLCAASQESPERREGRSLLVGFCNAKKMLCVASIFLASSINQSEILKAENTNYNALSI